MKISLTVLSAFLFLGPAVPAFAGATALSQLPAAGEVPDQPPAPVLAPALKTASAWLDLRLNNVSKSGFSMDDYSQAINISGYRDFDGDFRYSGTVDQKSFMGSLTRNQFSQDFTFEMGSTKLLVKRYSIHYKVTGFAAGAGGVLTPVDLLIRGGIRDRRYAVTAAAFELTSSLDAISGRADPASDNKLFVASIAAIMASLQSDAVLGVIETAGNYPNPFQLGNGTTLAYTLLQPADAVRITVYNAYGKVLKELDGNTAKGENRVFWDGRSDNNYDLMGQNILIWQLEIYFRGDSNKVIKQFTMNVR